MAGRIYPVPVKPASKIASWDGWPDDVRDTIRYWNSGAYWRSRGSKPNDALSFRRTATGSIFESSVSVFKCADCEEFCKPHKHGAAVLNGDWLCDDCLIGRARFHAQHYGAHRRAGRQKTSCLCAQPDNVRAAGGQLVVLPECGYHQLAAEFPDDHSIPWNCPTYWDGGNCAGKPKPDPASTETTDA